MDQLIRLQEHDNGRVSHGNFLQESLRRSVDMPAYMHWQTLSTEVSAKLRQGSVRINTSNIVEWTSNIETGGEKTPLIDHKQSITDGAEANSIRYADINSNESTKSPTNTWKVGVFLLVNTALGAGILNYPAAYDRLGGVTLSTVLQMIILVLIASTMLVLVYCADLHQESTYHDVLRSMGGKKIQQLAAMSIMATCFGINVTFLIIIGDQFDRLFHTFIGENFCRTFWFNRTCTIIFTAIFSIWPICFFKRLDFLRYVSTVGIFSMIYVVFLNIYEYYALEISPGKIKSRPTNTIAAIASLPVICFAYQTHEIVLPVYSCMAKPRSKNFLKATIVSLVFIFLIYTAGGTYGYLTFGDKVRSDIIQMYDASDPIVTAGILALIIKMVSTYTPLMFCGRGALDGLYAEWRKLSTEDYIKGERVRRITITLMWNLFALVLAVFTPNITIAIESLGSLAAFNVFVFPGVCMLSLSRRHLNGFYKKLNNERRLLQNLENTKQGQAIWCFLFTYGCFIILFGFSMVLIVLFQLINDIHQATQNQESDLLCHT